MEHEALKNAVIAAIENKNGGDIVAIDIGEKSSIADYFVIATGKNPAHVRAVVENIEETLEKQGVFVIRKEGLQEGRWAVLDYGAVIVHIFNNETRDFYSLEKLWK